MKAHLRTGISLLLAAAPCFMATAQTLPSPSHIVVLIEENYSYADIIGNSNAPHINAIATDTNAAVFTNFVALTHPSQANYMYMFSGANQGVTDDSPPTTYPWTTPNLAAELIAASKTFVTYSEDLPSVGSQAVTYTSGGANYARKHNPCSNWIGTGVNQIPATVSQPFTAFPASTAYTTLPTVCYVVPNMTNDMHDGSGPANIVLGDNWEHTNIEAYRQWCLSNNSLLVIIYDEDNDDTYNNNIPFIIYGPMVKGGTYTDNVNFYNFLRTIEDIYSLGHAGAAATATAITDCWKSSYRYNAGVASVVNNYSFQVMPNPASEFITFTCNNQANAHLTITVTDQIGKTIGAYSMDGSSLKVNTAALVAGVYYFRAMTANNEVAGEGKFVVAHN